MELKREDFEGMNLEAIASIVNLLESFFDGKVSEKGLQGMLMDIIGLKETKKMKVVVEGECQLVIKRTKEGWDIVMKEQHPNCGEEMCHVMSVTVKD